MIIKGGKRQVKVAVDNPSPYDGNYPLFEKYLRALKAMGRPLPRLRKKPRKTANG